MCVPGHVSKEVAPVNTCHIRIMLYVNDMLDKTKGVIEYTDVGKEFNKSS